MADSAIAGRFVGERAPAAIGAFYSLANTFICIAIGGSIGASVIISRYFGAKNYRKMKAAIYTALLSYLLSSILLGAVGLVFGRSIMTALNTPEDTLDMVLWEKQEISARDLGIMLHLDSGTLTPLLKRMQGMGLITRTRCDTDEQFGCQINGTGKY